MLAAVAAALFAQTAPASILFINNFSTGIGASEALTGAFSVADGYLGHHAPYADNERSSYRFTLDLTGISDAVLDFDFLIDTEQRFDPLNVFANGVSLYSLSGTDGGHLQKALTGGAPTTISFDFTSDFAANGRGVRLDNVAVSGTPAMLPPPGPAPVPEPATWGLMVLGFGAIGAALRERRTPAPALA